MYLSGPQRANVGTRISVNASGAPSGTRQVAFEARGNVGFDIIETTSGSASWSLAADFPGTTTIRAVAQDAYGGALDSASLSVTVSDPDFEQSRGQPPLNAGWFMGPASAEEGESVSLSISGLSDAARRAVFSAMNADLSSTQVHVSGGSASITARMGAAGHATIRATVYDENQTVAHEMTHSIQVSRRERADAYPANHTHGASMTRPQILSTPAIAGQPCQLHLRNLSGVESVIVEFYGANGGIFRLFPRGRSEMTTTLMMKAPGATTITASCRNAALDIIEKTVGKIDVQTHGSDTGVGHATPQPLMAASPGTLAPLGVHKPPYVVPVDTYSGERPASSQSASSASPSMYERAPMTPGEVARDMQARTDAMLNRLKNK